MAQLIVTCGSRLFKSSGALVGTRFFVAPQSKPMSHRERIAGIVETVNPATPRRNFRGCCRTRSSRNCPDPCPDPVSGPTLAPPKDLLSRELTPRGIGKVDRTQSRTRARRWDRSDDDRRVMPPYIRKSLPASPGKSWFTRRVSFTRRAARSAAPVPRERSNPRILSAEIRRVHFLFSAILNVGRDQVSTGVETSLNIFDAPHSRFRAEAN
jgi:hypothetical protein